MTLDAALPLPLVVFPEPCPYRDAALAALAHAGVDYRIAVVCPSSGGVHAAVQAGLGVTPMPRSRIDGAVAIVPDSMGLPTLPDVEFALFGTASPAELADELCEAVQRDLVG
jgi:DNA-binding transcriptional LysR family regulator